MKDMLQQVRGIFEANGCEVVMVDKVTFKHDREEESVSRRQYSSDWIKNVSDDIDEFSVKKVYLLSAELIQTGDVECLVIKAFYSETL